MNKLEEQLPQTVIRQPLSGTKAGEVSRNWFQTYNTGRGARAIVPALVGFVTSSSPLGKAIDVCAICSYSLVLIDTALLPKTHRKQFDANA
jgi:hypothetical protein